MGGRSSLRGSARGNSSDTGRRCVGCPDLLLNVGLRLIAAVGLAAFVAANGDIAVANEFRVIHEFQGGKDGKYPAGLILDGNGALYGMTESGGNGDPGCAGGGCGTVFKLTPTPIRGHAWKWTETVLYRFTGRSDGGTPLAGLIFDSSGALYGTTQGGGAGSNCPSYGCQGTVFKLTPPATEGDRWRESVLYSFCSQPGCTDGADPAASLIFDANGTLYGTTYAGGAHGTNTASGTVFKLTPPATKGGAWSESVLYSFCSQPNCADGYAPSSNLIFDGSGALYGTTGYGGIAAGTVFKLTRSGNSWKETVLHRFRGFNDASNPLGGLIFDAAGALYGTASTSTGPFFGGAVFKLTPPPKNGRVWRESVLYFFCQQNLCTDGQVPMGNLIFDAGGALYGTTSASNNSSQSTDNGVVFKLAPPTPPGHVWTESVLHSFNGSDGSSSFAGLIMDGRGYLFGTATWGGTGSCSNSPLPNGCGTVFAVNAGHVLIVAKSGNGSGTVASSPPGISCGVTCAASFEPGTQVTLTANSAAGSKFVGWSGNSACHGIGSCELPMTARESVTASFMRSD